VLEGTFVGSDARLAIAFGLMATRDSREEFCLTTPGDLRGALCLTAPGDLEMADGPTGAPKFEKELVWKTASDFAATAGLTTERD